LDLKQATASASIAVALSIPAFLGAGTVLTAPPRPSPPENLFDWWVRVPDRSAKPAPAVQRSVRDVLRWTGWSHRKFARVLGTTHPTVSALELGTTTGSSIDRDRLEGVHEVVQRIHVLAGRERDETDRLLSTQPDGRPSAFDLLSESKAADAYLAALDVIRPRRTSGMMSGMWPATPGRADSVAADELS